MLRRMTERTWWFSSMVEFALHVQGDNAYQVMKSVVLVRANGFDQADPGTKVTVAV